MANIGDGTNDGRFTIGRGDGISQAIAKEIGLTDEQCKKVDWRSVFDLVDQAKNDSNSSVNYGGGNDLSRDGHTGNYKVNAGDEFQFSADIWKRIVDVVKNSLTRKGIDIDNLSETKESTEEEVIEQESWQEPDPYNPEPAHTPSPLTEDAMPADKEGFHQMICEAIKSDWVTYDEDGKKPLKITFPNDGIDIEIEYGLDKNISRFVETHHGNGGIVEREIHRNSKHEITGINDYMYEDGKKAGWIGYKRNGTVYFVVDYYPDGITFKQGTVYNEDGTVQYIETFNKNGNVTRENYPAATPPYYEIIEYKSDGVTEKSRKKYNMDGGLFVE